VCPTSSHTPGQLPEAKAAAAFLGVSLSAMRNLDRAGKLKPTRHPVNHYSLYRRADLEIIRAAGLTPSRAHE
jgi:DNA-binding transcriptional MerR regulator